MKLYTNLFFLFMFCLVTDLDAQENQKLDSLLKLYHTQKEDTSKVVTAHNIYKFYQDYKLEMAIPYLRNGHNLAQKLNFKNGIAKSNALFGTYYRKISLKDSAKYYYNKALKEFKELNNYHETGIITYELTKMQSRQGAYDEALNICNKQIDIYSKKHVDSAVIMRFYDLKAIIYTRKTNYKAGFENAFIAYNIHKGIQDSSYEVPILRTLGLLYHYSNDKEKALDYKFRVLKLLQNSNNKRELASILNNIGNTYYSMGKPKEGLPYFEQSLTISKEIKFYRLIAITSFNLGKYGVDYGKIDKGINYLKNSLYISTEISKNPIHQVWALNWLGSGYNKLNQPKKALDFLDKALIITDSLGDKDDQYMTYENRSRSYELIGNYKKSLDDYKNYKAINDSVYNISKTHEIERLTITFETEKKEQQIALQENEITVLEQEAEISNLQKLLLGFGLGLSLLLFSIGYYALRQKIKRNKLEKEKLDNELAFKKKELTTHALHLAKKNEALVSLKQKAEALKTSKNNTNGYQQLIRTINFDLQDDNNWENFSKYFQEVHKDFNSIVKQKFTDITSNELRLMSLIKMNLSTKEIANILNISVPGVKKARQRLRKKMQLSTNDSLEDAIIAI